MTLTAIPLETDDVDLLRRATLDNLNWSGERFREEDLERPEFRHYTHLDAARGNFGFAALVDGAPVGVVWLLHLSSTDPGYGYVDDETPELSIWTAPQHRTRADSTRSQRGAEAQTASNQPLGRTRQSGLRALQERRLSRRTRPGTRCHGA